MKKIIVGIGFLATQMLFSQEKNYSIEEFKNILVTQPIQFSEKLSVQDLVQIEWIERKSSYNPKIQTFVGYKNGEFQAIVSILDDSIFGSIWHNGEEIRIKSKNDILSFNKVHTTAEHHKCFTEHREEAQKKQNRYGRTGILSPSIKNTDIFRIYRLAVAVDYSLFSNEFNNNEAEVSVFLANLETFLNEVYERDLGVRFELINNANLIKKASNSAFFNAESQSIIISQSTQKINGILGEANYDLGIMLTKSTVSGGLAFVGGAYEKIKKAGATVGSNNLKTIAHEIGHLFGGIHTFSNTPRRAGNNTEQTEKGYGYSVMSYGREPLPRDFFSLSSIERIREKLVTTPYYDTTGRDFVIGSYKSTDNIPYGIKLNNSSPTIDRTKIKSEYIIPHNTFFQFYISATDIDNNTLQYMVQQRDVRMYEGTTTLESITKYPTYKAVDTNLVKFQSKYNDTGALIPDTDINNITGDFTFWIGVRDNANGQHTPYYDLAETKVKVVTGTPFVFTNTFSNNYNANDKITLNWNVDKTIFPEGSKVRILLSDDFGETYKHILVHQTENDGIEEITLPNIEIGNVKVGSLNPAGGVIKVEVIDGLAYALSVSRPAIGGFLLKKINVPNEKSYIGKVGINTEKPNASLEIGKIPLNNQPQGVSIPQLSNSVKAKINTYILEEGLMIYNTDKKCIEFWNGREWRCTDGTSVESVNVNNMNLQPTNIGKIGINTSTPKATLHIGKNINLKDTEVQGVILPKFTTQERATFFKVKLNEGLMIYNTDKKCIEFWNGKDWSCLDGSQKDSLTNLASATDTQISYYIGINTSEPKSSLDISSGNSPDVEGVIIPQISTSERDKFILDESQEGVMLYNTDKKCIEFWNGTQWKCANN